MSWGNNIYYEEINAPHALKYGELILEMIPYCIIKQNVENVEISKH